MPKPNRPNRKASDEDIIRLNSVGLSLKTIGKELGCHPTTIVLRLGALGIPPADTRRAFMEDIYKQLPPDQQAWLAEQLGPTISIKDFVHNLLVERYLTTKNKQASNG